MLSDAEVLTIAGDAAKSVLGDLAVTTVKSEPAEDSEGHEAIRLTLVMKPGEISGLSGSKSLDALYEIQKNLALAGEERFVIVEYASTKEFARSGSSKS